MKMIKALLLSIFICTLHAEIPFTWARGLHAVSTREHLSVINGMIWWEQNIVEHMYRYGDKNDATIQLIWELFYLQHDGVSFRPTIYDAKPATHFTPTIIGKIIAAITDYRDGIIQPNEKKLKETLQNIIQEKISNIKNEFEANKTNASPLKKRLAELTAQENTLKPQVTKAKRLLKKKTEESDEQKSALQTIELMKKIAQEKIKIKEKLEQELAELRKNKAYEIQYQKTIKKPGLLNVALKNINSLVDILIASIKECKPNDEGQKYIPYTTEQILLAFLWATSNPGEKPRFPEQDFVDYFKMMPKLVDTDAIHLWLSNLPFTKKNYEDFVELVEDTNSKNMRALILDNYETAALSALGHRAWMQPLPPIITGATVTYTHPTKNTGSFSDCVETSLRNFFNIMLYNSEKKGIFDIERLIEQASKDSGEIVLHISDALINFYKKYNKVESLRTKEAYNEFTAVVEDLLGVDYVNDFYEIRSLLSNVLKIINHLIFGNNPTFDALSNNDKLDLICKKLSRPDFNLTWNSNTNVNTNNFVNLQFLINENTYKFEWLILYGHAVIPQKKEKNHFPCTDSRFIVYLATLPWDFKNYSAASLFITEDNFKRLSNEVINNYNFTFLLPNILEIIKNILSTESQQWYAFAQNTFSKLNIEQEIATAIGVILTQRSNQFYGFVTNKLPTLRNKEEISSLLEIILKKRSNQFYDFVTDNLHILHSEKEISPILGAILSGKVDRFYDFVTSKLPTLQNEKEISKLLEIILKEQLDKYYDFVTDNLHILHSEEEISPILNAIFSKKVDRFYDFATSKLPTLHNETEIYLLLYLILIRELNKFYDFVTSKLPTLFTTNKKFPTLQEEKNITNLLGIILLNKLDQFYDIAKIKAEEIGDFDFLQKLSTITEESL